MSNIVALNVPPRRQRLSERTAALIDTFARRRRRVDDVFWLKENAELLNILECTGQRPGVEALAPLAPFYADLPGRLAFFPQYYRFLLSIALDLEALGLPGDLAAGLCRQVARQGLPDAELSDLQRAEARRLLARRGTQIAQDPGLDDRLRDFIQRPATFAIPNKKAAYELTHIVFYLSEYGRCDPSLDDGALSSLHHTGTLAFLEQNMDLLAEVCVALRHARRVPPATWESAVRRHLSEFRVLEDESIGMSDGYHEYFVSTWSVLLTGHDDSGAAVLPATNRFAAPPSQGALHEMSLALMEMDASRSADWGAMRAPLLDRLSEPARAVVSAAETATPQFDPFFEIFARAPGRAA